MKSKKIATLMKNLVFHTKSDVNTADNGAHDHAQGSAEDLGLESVI